MNFLQKLALRFSGLDLKRVGNQAPLVNTYSDGRPVLDPWDMANAVEVYGTQNPFLHAALRKKAEAVASIPFYVEEWHRNQRKWERVENHPAEHLIEGANPHLSGSELKALWVFHKDLTGWAFTQIVMSKGEPVFLQPLYPQFMRPIPSRSNFLDGFEYTLDAGNPRIFKPGEVFWTKYPHPADPYRAMAPIESVLGELQVDLEAIRWNKTTLGQRGATDVAFILRDITTPDQYNLARKMVEDRYAGGDNGRRPWIIGGNSEVRPLSYNPVEMDYLNTRTFDRQVIAAAIGVPAPLVGDADNSTYNNLDTLKRVFWEDTISTFLEQLRQDLTRQVLLPLYADQRGTTRSPRYRYMYDLSNVEALSQNMLERAEVSKLLSQAGFSAEQINARLELGMDFENFSAGPAPVQAVPSVEPAAVQAMASEFAEMLKGRLTSRPNPSQFGEYMVEVQKAISGRLNAPLALPEAQERGRALGKALEVAIAIAGPEEAYKRFERLMPNLARTLVKEASKA